MHVVDQRYRWRWRLRQGIACSQVARDGDVQLNAGDDIQTNKQSSDRGDNTEQGVVSTARQGNSDVMFVAAVSIKTLRCVHEAWQLLVHANMHIVMMTQQLHWAAPCDGKEKNMLLMAVSTPRILLATLHVPCACCMRCETASVCNLTTASQRQQTAVVALNKQQQQINTLSPSPVCCRQEAVYFSNGAGRPVGWGWWCSAGALGRCLRANWRGNLKYKKRTSSKQHV